MGINPSVEQLVNYCVAYAEYYKQLKMASINNPLLFYQYEEQQIYYKALADRYKAMIPDSTMVGALENSNSSLLQQLQNGGYILYARHGEAKVGKDQANLNLLDCSTQRNLSEDGKRQAVTYGETLRTLNIPIQYPVLVSPLCRTRQTAGLAFGNENIEVDPILLETFHLGGNLNAAEQQRIINDLQSVLEIQPLAGSNQVIIAHSFPQEIGLGKIPSMGTVIVKPLGQGKGYEVVARVSLEELTSFKF